jgi:hypothetical protein
LATRPDETPKILEQIEKAEALLAEATQNYKKAGAKFVKGTTVSGRRRTYKSQMNSLTKEIDELAEKASRQSDSRDQLYLRGLGLSAKKQDLIRRMWDTHGTEDAGISAPNMQKWSDPRARRFMREALIRATDSTIVTPTAGSMPHVMRSSMGKLFFQFQSFPVTVMEKIVLPSLQRFPEAKPEVMSGMAMALTLGAAVSILKDLAKGDEPDLRPGHLARQSLDRSGLFGPYMTGLRPIEDLTGLDRLFPEGFADDHRSRDPITEFMGAWVRTGKDYANIIGGAAQGDWDSQGFASAIRRQIPFNNIFYLNWLNRSAQELITGQELD